MKRRVAILAMLAFAMATGRAVAGDGERSPIDVPGSIEDRYGEPMAGQSGPGWELAEGTLLQVGFYVAMHYDAAACVHEADARVHAYSFLPEDAEFVASATLNDAGGPSGSRTEIWQSDNYADALGLETFEEGMFLVEYDYQAWGGDGCAMEGGDFSTYWLISPLFEPFGRGDAVDVITWDAPALYAEPALDAGVVLDAIPWEMSTGAEVQRGPVTNADGIWYRIALNDGTVGWVQDTALVPAAA